jgi:gluconate 2-dehydrogenase gamma chain
MVVWLMRKKKSPKHYRINPSLKSVEWLVSRKGFLVSAALGTLASQLPVKWLSGEQTDTPSMLSTKQKDIVESVQGILFPADGNGPGAADIHALEYLQWVLSDKEKDPEEVEYIMNGIGWVDETAVEDTGKPYLEMDKEEREALIEKISRKDWGESWLSVILTLIFEALLCDPQYGGNPDETGWKWLSHNPGQPRPTPSLLYPNILTKKTTRE